MSETIRILIADDHELIRMGLISILRATHPEWQIVADVGSGNDAVDKGAVLRPDVAVLDLTMPDFSGLEAAERLLETVPDIRIIILTMYAAAPILHQARKVGVHAYLAKNEAPKMLVKAIERVLAGEAFFASNSASRPRVEAPEYIPVQFLLTSREIEVLRLLARGKSNKELAADLDISVRTAESHHANIIAKLGVESLADLVRLALRDGIN